MQHKRVKAAYAAATVFFIGYLKPAPGTLGSVVTVPFALLLWRCGPFIYIAAALLIGLIGYWASAVVLEDIKTSDTPPVGAKAEDPSYIIIDEVLGMFITLFLPFSLLHIILPLPLLALVGLLFFRLFDILKPFNIGWIDKNIKGAVGVMMDDVAAGLYAGVTAALLLMAGTML
jgi:phosphatidylglycerophosphatase A